MDIPSAGDVCNAGSFQERDQLEAKKTSAAWIPLWGALLSSVAAVVAFVSAVQKRPPGRGQVVMAGLTLLGAVGLVVGASTALLTYAVIC